MAGQSGQNVVLAFKAQGAMGTPASGASGFVVRAAPSAGLALEIARIRGTEARGDGASLLGRLGSQLANAEYMVPLSVGGADKLLEAGLRGTWSAGFDITQSDITSITTTASTIVAASGSFITLGVRRGNMIKLASHATTANNGKWLRVVNVTASTITTPTGDLVLDASPDTTITISVARQLYMPLAGSLVERYFTVDQYWADLDLSLTGVDMKVAGFGLKIAPNDEVMMSFRLVGRDVVPLASGASPTFTSPTETTGRPVIIYDGSIRINDTDDSVTGFELAHDLGGSGLEVTGSRLSPDVYLDNAKGSGSISAPVTGTSRFTSMKAGDEFATHLLLSENDSDPKDFISFYYGSCSYTGPYRNPQFGTGAQVESLGFEYGLDVRGTGCRQTMVLVSTSAA